jgi:PAB-dependent poly(A)-specific ribonuclease subunit 2
MGFVFDMLDKAEGTICHATNLLKTLSIHPQAGPLGLLEEDAPGASLTNMLQGLNRFLLDKIAQDYRSIPPHSAAFDQVDNPLPSLWLLANSIRFLRPLQPWPFDA